MKENWQYKKLGEVCEIVGRIGFRGYTRNDLVEKGNGAISLSPSNIIEGKLSFDGKISYISWDKYFESPEIMLEVNDVVFTKTASVGKCALVKYLPVETTLNPQLVVFKKIQCNSAFLTYVLQGNRFQETVLTQKGGTSIPTITQAFLGNLLVPIPPISEQERIVAELDLLAGIIEKQKQQLKELDTLSQSIFYSMFGDPITNEKEWKVNILGNVLKTTSGGTPSTKQKEYYENGSIPWINSGDLHQTYIYSASKFITENGLNNSSAKLLPINTVLLAMYGATVGEVSILKIQAATNQAVCGIYPSQLYSSVFLFYVLKFSKEYFMKVAMGGAQPNISQTVIKAFKLISPPISLQNEFAEKIEKIEKQKEAINKSIEETQKLFDYTMDKYFG